MNKTEQETPSSEETIKFRPRIGYTFFGPFNRPGRLLKGWNLFPFHSVDYKKIEMLFYPYLKIHDCVFERYSYS